MVTTQMTLFDICDDTNKVFLVNVIISESNGFVEKDVESHSVGPSSS